MEWAQLRPFGPTGRLQALLEWLDIPYVGSSVAASALGMNKVLFKHFPFQRMSTQLLQKSYNERQ